MKKDGIRRNGLQLLASNHIDLSAIRGFWPEVPAATPEVEEQIYIEALYHGYLQRQTSSIEEFRKDESLTIPDWVDYANVGSLSKEMTEKLSHLRPATIGAALRVQGITPAAITALLAHIKRPSSHRAA